MSSFDICLSAVSTDDKLIDDIQRTLKNLCTQAKCNNVKIKRTKLQSTRPFT